MAGEPQQPLTPDPTREPGGTDPAAESLSRALRAGFNILRTLMVLLLVAYFLSGWFRVNPGEQGIIVRLGKLRINRAADSPHAGTAVFDPGLHISLPDPFDEKIRISGESRTLQIDTFCFVRDEKDIDKPLVEVLPVRDSFRPGTDGYLITGDHGMVHALWTVEYRIRDAEKFVRFVGENEQTVQRLLRRLTEDAIIGTVAGMPIDDVLRANVSGAVTDFTVAVRRRVNAMLDRIGTGVVVDKVTAVTIEPGSVREAFIKVANARSEAETEINRARQEQERILSSTAGREYQALLDAIDAYGAAQAAGASDERLAEMRAQIDRMLEQAEGQVASRLQEARSKADEIRETVRREFESFRNWLDLYKKAPQVTALRLWVQLRDEILTSKQNEVFYLPDVNHLEIIVNRDLRKLLEAEAERFRKKVQGPTSPPGGG